ncbi:asparagine synthetase B family protein [Erythrobacter colymbi]|uniref:asparagine synthetase B family protein n=1 Tax=Erythrobacter colymbi TaxID=1161202 RepID=UPI000A373FB3|nr:asparagine synthase-related protein [Erythrobacter colymbi]
MSGICASLRLDGGPQPGDTLVPVLAGLARRGPDGSRTASDGPVALGHALNATTPEALAEPMPFRHAGTGCLITAHARLDNRADLIAILGIDTTSRVVGDGELILAAYLAWGRDCPARLLGDFAFVLWDPRHQRLFAARDKVGMRQLIYHFAPGKLFACASDVDALLAHPDVPRRINEVRIADFLEELEAADLTSTFFEDVHRLPPAHALSVENGMLRIWRYWQLEPAPVVHRASDREYEEAFLSVFTEAVRARLRTPDGTLGSMLSGGMDSGSVVAVAARLLAEAGAPPLRTFSAIHTDPECLESRAIALAMTQPHIAPHTVSTGAPEEFRDEVAALTRECADPFDGTMAVIRAIYLKAQRAGVRVMLDGVGGDTTLSTGNIALWHLEHGRLLAGWRETLGDERYWGDNMPARPQFYSLLRQQFMPDALRRLKRRLRPAQTAGHATSEGLADAAFAERIGLAARLEQDRVHTATGNDSSSATRAAKMLHPFLHAGRERYDRVAAEFAIEPRDPFLDVRLLEFCLTLPADRIKREGWPKLILRRAMEGYMPDALRWRTGRTHVGFRFNDICSQALSTATRVSLAGALDGYVNQSKLAAFAALQVEDSALAYIHNLGYLGSWINRNAFSGAFDGD